MSLRVTSGPALKWYTQHILKFGTAAATALLPLPALADPIPPGWQTSNLEVVGFTGLEGRAGAFKLAIKHARNDHWYLYAGHSFDQGWSIIDVTDPKNPKYVKFIPYSTPTKEVLTAQVTLHDDIMITAIDKVSKTDPTLLIWDIRDPENPKKIGQWKGAEGGSHRNSYPKDPAKPRLMSIFPAPRPPKDAPFKSFCDKEGRFGPHNTVMELHNPDVHRQGNTMYITWFNAGLRAYDISDPYMPTEVGWFMPPERPDAKAHEGPHAAPTNWMEDVAQDARGYIYADDDKWGIWILRDPNQK